MILEANALTSRLTANERGDVTIATDDMYDQYDMVLLDAINDDIVASGEASKAWLKDEILPLTGILFSLDPGQSAALYIGGELNCFDVGSDHAACAACQRRLCLVDRREYLQAPTLAFFPQG
jgi:hypothetical protein